MYIGYIGIKRTAKKEQNNNIIIKDVRQRCHCDRRTAITLHESINKIIIKNYT